MKQLIILVLFCVVSPIIFAQNIQRSSLGISGSTAQITVGENIYYISQSIGQTSVIGTFSNNKNAIRQGYQQPPIRVENLPNSNSSLNAIAYPNPVSTFVTILFNETLKSVINIIIYDVSGKIILTKSQKPEQSFNIDMSPFASGMYLLNINSGNKNFTARLIKK